MLNPLTTENIKKPFFWSLLSKSKLHWCNSGSGWASTPDNAWVTAYSLYLIHIESHKSHL